MTEVERIQAIIEVDGRSPELMSRLLKAQAREAAKTWKPPKRVRRRINASQQGPWKRTMLSCTK